jgi:diguanylate cyclase (GGDEF)-like protein
MTAVDRSGAIAIADRVWWVGSVRPDDTFQCHAYLIEAGDDSVLIDPGSVLSIDETLRRAAEVVPLSSIRWVVCHHSDPDIAGGLAMVRKALPREDLRLVTEWRAETLLRHYDADIPFYRVEDHGWAVPLDGTRELQFVLTPYLHFPGAMCSYERSSGVLFSSDLFGGFTDGSQLIATDETYFESMRPFHEHYMPSREILAAGLGRILRAFGPITLIAPQHGCIIPEPLVAQMFEQLAELECGIFLMAREDLDVARLLRVATVLRRITDALVMAHDFPELAAIAERVLPDVLPVTTLELFAETSEEGLLRFSAADHFLGTPCELVEPLGSTVSFEIPGDGARARIVIGLTHAVDLTTELREMFARLAPPLRVALNRHLEQRHIEQEHDELRESALHDALTGLYNRHALGALAKVDQQYGVLMIDIDHFKGVNDRFGHSAGDEVLRSVATAIGANVRPNDSTIRYGGEEILVLLTAADRTLTSAVAERVRGRVGDLVYASVPELGSVTVSIGAAIHHRGQPVDEAIADADGCLYRAKNEGRNQVRTAWQDLETV